MSLYPRIARSLWIAALACACGWIGCLDWVRIGRIEAVTGLAGGPGVPRDARSATGYSGSQRGLILPGRSEASFHWISETQQMLASGEARVRRFDGENAPFGRPVLTPSPYRWWLGTIAWCGRALTGRPLGLCAEDAALVADPLLLLLALAAATVVVARTLGGLPATLTAAGLALAYPLAAGFAPGMPDPRGLAEICALGSILPAVIGLGPSVGGRGRRGWFILSGLAGALGVWVSTRTEFPVLLGIALGGFLAARMAPEDAGGGPSWRAWGLTGAAAVLAAYVAEFFPGEMGTLRLDSVHPLYGVAWLGAGELLRQASGRKGPWTRRNLVHAGLAAGLVLALPLAMAATHMWGFLSRDLVWARLGGLAEAPGGASSGSLFMREGASAVVLATVAPLAALLPAALGIALTRGRSWPRARMALAAGPAMVALAFAWEEPSWWSVLDVPLVVIPAAAAAAPAEGEGRARRRVAVAGAIILAVAGVAAAVPRGPQGADAVLTPAESEELVVRHLGHWLSSRTGTRGPIVFAPPDETTLLCYYGGLRGIGTYAPENTAGFSATLSLAGARTLGEIQDQVENRGIRYIVIPSWDPFFENFARLYLASSLADRQSLFSGELRHLHLPPWLRPVPYQLPVGGGFEGQSVLVLEVVDPQTPALLAGRVAEYLVEMGDTSGAKQAADDLRRYPGDVGALAARAQVASAAGDREAFELSLESIEARLSVGGDRYLPWDRRVSLAIVLARANRAEACRNQVGRCIDGVSEERLRSLSTGSLYALLVLSRTFHVEIADPGLRDLALELLPPGVRSRL